jgi:putative flippase GtrA
MKTRSIWTILGVVVAVAIAWFLIEVLFSVMWFIAKLAAVVFVAIIVFFLLRALFSRAQD